MWYLTEVLSSISLIMSDADHLSRAVGHLYVFLGEMSAQVFGPPLNCVAGILYIFWILTNSLWFVNISASLSVVLSLLCEHPLTHEVFNFLRSSVSNFHCFLCLWCHTFGPTTQARVKKIQHHQTSSIQFSPSVVSDCLWPHGLQHARFPCPSPTPRACSNSCPSSRWCHLTTSSSVGPFSSRLQSSTASVSFPMSQFFASGGQSIGASASVLPTNIQDWFPFGWTGWISLQSRGLSRVFSNTTVQKHQFFGAQLSLWSNSHIYTWLLEKL